MPVEVLLAIADEPLQADGASAAPAGRAAVAGHGRCTRTSGRALFFRGRHTAGARNPGARLGTPIFQSWYPDGQRAGRLHAIVLAPPANVTCGGVVCFFLG
jgi:hypothetical protein